MNYIPKYAMAVALMLAVQLAQAMPFGSEARTLAMGNAGVAVADIAAAPFINPAMLAQQNHSDDFALLLPAVGIFLDDSDGVLDKIDAYQAAESSGDQAAQLAAAVSLLGKSVSPQATAATSIGVSFESFSFAVSARGDVLLAGGIANPAQDLTELTDPNKNLLALEGIATREVGVTLATNMDMMGGKLAVGVTPKVISIDLLDYSESLSTVDTGSNLINQDNISDLGSVTTLDAGLAWRFSENMVLGLAAKNLLTDEIKKGPATVKFDTQVRAGVGYRGSFFRLAVDADLTENDSILSLIPQTKSRMVSLGAEFNAFDFAQLRVGMQKNTASGISDGAKKPLLTAGVGFWLGFNFDLTVARSDNVLGIFAQTGFRF